MAGAGLGHGRIPFELDRVRVPDPLAGWRDVFAHGRALAGATAAPSLPAIDDLGRSQIVLRFLTPIRLKSNAHFQTSVGFRALAFAILRRTLEIAHFHVPGASIDWTFRPLLEQASAVRVVASRLRWHDWQRYSTRQGTPMTLGGFVGELEVEGPLTPFAPLLRTAEILHVSKGATFGLGRMEVV
jgi:hypothetical protein